MADKIERIQVTPRPGAKRLRIEVNTKSLGLDDIETSLEGENEPTYDEQTEETAVGAPNSGDYSE